MLAIYKKELRAYFINPIGYVFIGVFLTFAALSCCYTTIIQASYSTTNYFTIMIFAFAILIPLLTMRSFAEERKLKTEQLLLTAPVTITGMVFGKYLAALTIYLGSMLTSLVNLIPIYVIGKQERANTSYSVIHIGPVTSQIVGEFVGVLLLGAAFIAIGVLISSLTENQLSAAVVSISVILVMVLINLLNNATDRDGQQLISNYAIRFVLNWVSVLDRYSIFGTGRLDLAGLVYYASLVFVSLFLTIRVYEKRRWS